jgi:hypothetical protein
MSDNKDQNLTPTLASTGSPVISGDSPNLAGALLGGLIAAVVGAVIWAAITVTAQYQIGFMAVGVGLLVGWTVRTVGKGRDVNFGLVGGGLSLLGCLLGNLLAACGLIAAQAAEPVMSVTLRVLGNPASIATVLQETFRGMDLLFYAIGVYEGYKFARRP